MVALFCRGGLVSGKYILVFKSFSRTNNVTVSLLYENRSKQNQILMFS